MKNTGTIQQKYLIFNELFYYGHIMGTNKNTHVSIDKSMC